VTIDLVWKGGQLSADQFGRGTGGSYPRGALYFNEQEEKNMRKIASFVVAVSATAVMMIAGECWAGPICHDVHVEATDSAVNPMLPFGNWAGTAMVTVDGGSPIPATVSLIPANIRITDDGTVHMTNTLTFDVGPLGSLTVQDNAVLSPTATPYLYRMNSRLDNAMGSGEFSGAIGRFTDHGELNFATMSLIATADGRICW
jgi:hypothetical protein